MRKLRRLAAAQMLALSLAAPASAQDAPRIVLQEVDSPKPLAFHPKAARLLLVSDRGGRVALLDFADPASPVVRHVWPSYYVHAAFLADGRVVTAESDGMLRFWSEAALPAGAPVRATERELRSMTVSPKGRLVATVDEDGLLRIFSAAGEPVGAPIKTIAKLDECDTNGYVNFIAAFSPDEKWIASTREDCAGMAVRALDGRRVPIPDAKTDGMLAEVAFTEDGRWLVARAQFQPGSRAHAWPIAGGAIGRGVTIKGFHDYFRLAPGLDPGSLAYISSNRVAFFAPDGRIRSPQLDLYGAETAAVAADKSRIAISDGARIRLWSRDLKPLVAAPFLAMGGVRAKAVSPDGERIAIANSAGQMRLWSRAGEPLGPPIAINRAAGGVPDIGGRSPLIRFTADGKRLVTIGIDRVVRVFTADGRPMGAPWRLRSIGDRSGYSEDEKVLADDRVIALTKSENGVEAFDLAGRPMGKPVTVEGRQIESFSTSADGRTIAILQYQDARPTIVSSDGKTRRQLAAAPFQPSWIELSPDGRLLVAGNLSRGNEERLFLWRSDGEWAHARASRLIGFLPDGRIVHTSSTGLTIEGAEGAPTVFDNSDWDGSIIALMPKGDAALYLDDLGPRVVAFADIKAAPPDRFWRATSVPAAALLSSGALRWLTSTGAINTAVLGEPIRTARGDLNREPRLRRFVTGDGSTVIVGGMLDPEFAFDADGSRLHLVSRRGDDGVMLMLNEAGNRLFGPATGWWVAASPSGDRVAVFVGKKSDKSPDDPYVALYDRDGALIARTSLPQATARFITGAAAADGRVAVGVGSQIRFLDRDGNLLAQIIEAGDAVSDIAFVAGDRQVAARGKESVLKRWTLDGGPLPDGPKLEFWIGGYVFSPDGKWLLARGDSENRLGLWAVEADGTFRAIGALPLRLATNGRFQFGFGADRVWALSDQRTVHWFDLALKPLATMHMRDDGYLAELPDGRHCGHGPIFDARRIVRGASEVTGTERDGLVDCAAVKRAIGAP